MRRYLEGRGLTVTSPAVPVALPGREATEGYLSFQSSGGPEAAPEAHTYQKQNHENRQLSGRALHQHFMGSYRLPKISYLQTRLLPTSHDKQQVQLDEDKKSF